MKNKLGTSDSELIDRNLDHESFDGESYSEEDSKEYSAEMMRQRITSDGEKWIEMQKLKLKLEGIEDYYGFTVKSVRRNIQDYMEVINYNFDEDKEVVNMAEDNSFMNRKFYDGINSDFKNFRIWSQQDKINASMSLKKDIITKINTADDRLENPIIYQAAALLLTNLEKGKSPYFGLSGDENSGLWVKALLGKRHFDHFMEEKKNCIKELETVSSKWEKRPLEDMLASCELDYIFHNVLGANSHLKYFGSCEGSNNQDGITNPSNIILSEKFADRLSTYKQLLIKSHTEHLK